MVLTQTGIKKYISGLNCLRHTSKSVLLPAVDYTVHVEIMLTGPVTMCSFGQLNVIKQINFLISHLSSDCQLHVTVWSHLLGDLDQGYHESPVARLTSTPITNLLHCWWIAQLQAIHPQQQGPIKHTCIYSAITSITLVTALNDSPVDCTWLLLDTR